MDLSFDEFVDILASFRTRDRSKDAGDKRRARRIGYRAQVFITPCENKPSDASNRMVPALLRDFSPRGVSFLCDHEMTRGQSFVLHLKQRDNKPVEMLSTVVHCLDCRPTGKLPYLIGAEFSGLVEPEAAPRQTDPHEADLDRIRCSILG